MPAAALRHPETDEELVVPAVSNSPLSPNGSSDTLSPQDSANPEHSDIEWHSVAPFVDRFSAAHEVERPVRNRRSRRHKHFILSGAYLAGALVIVELMGLVWVYALDSTAIRQSGALDRQIQEITLQKSLAQNKLASYKSSPVLTQWAQQLGYRPIGPEDFDDVTSNAPVPAPQPEAKH